MKAGLYSKLAWEGIRKNKCLYVPYILAGSSMVAVSYILLFLDKPALTQLKGGRTLRILLPAGTLVVAAFALFFLLYANSFLIRRRSRELGVYHILGMDKRNLAQVITWDAVYAGGISIAFGLSCGILFSKIAELLVCNLLQGDVAYTLRVDWKSVGMTALRYAGIYGMLLAVTLLRIHRLSPLKLLQRGQAGERPPRANWIITVLGMIILGTAYWIALTIRQPIAAIFWFVAAVLLVIAATYLLFISGSVTLCRLQQRNRQYYYQPYHFVAVSSMSFRMKRNGAGLASICILSTMVLVTLSSTLSLYIGMEDAIAAGYPRDICLCLEVPTAEDFQESVFASMRSGIDELVPNRANSAELSCVEISGLFTDDGMQIGTDFMMESFSETYENAGQVYLVSLETYNRVMGTNESLSDGECLFYNIRTNYTGISFKLGSGEPLRIHKKLTELYVPGFVAVQTKQAVFLIVSNPEDFLMTCVGTELGDALKYLWCFDFDVDGSSEEIQFVYREIQDHIHMGKVVIHNSSGGYSYSVACRETAREETFSTYAGLLFIAVLLSIVFLLAAILIIYYKQVSEGYEDQKRFSVLQKVGMTALEIRRSVNSQVLTVFFAPLLLAGLHLAFAFPILWKLLQLFNFSNLRLMIEVTAGSFAVFALIYAVVYRITSNVYYAIVSKGNAELN